jgi:hypothetical protein
MEAVIPPEEDEMGWEGDLDECVQGGGVEIHGWDVLQIHCPRSGPVLVQPDFGGPGPKVRSSICLDLDLQGPDRVWTGSDRV